MHTMIRLVAMDTVMKYIRVHEQNINNNNNALMNKYFYTAIGTNMKLGWYFTNLILTYHLRFSSKLFYFLHSTRINDYSF